jgi:hypothetical protein
VSAQQSATPTQPQQQHGQLIELFDRHRITYSWDLHGTADGNGAGVDSRIKVQQQQQQQQTARQRSDQQQQLLPSPAQSQQLSEQQQVLLDALRTLYLPAGFPSSVTDDYLAYQLYTIPAHITGWLSSSLTTSSLLKAVGINAGEL